MTETKVSLIKCCRLLQVAKARRRIDEIGQPLPERLQQLCVEACNGSEANGKRQKAEIMAMLISRR